MINKSVPNMPDKYYQGKYVLINKDKYIGIDKWIWYRSSWEFKFAKWCDLNVKVIRWGSEIIKVPYIGLDGLEHTYYPDFYVELKNENLDIRWLIEIKPKKETLEPKRPVNENSRSLKNYEYALKTYLKNIRKWTAANNFCKQKNIEFKIITEDILNSMFKIKY